MTHSFTVPMIPVAKERPRIFMRGRFPHAYTPSKTQKAERTIAKHARASWKQPALTCPIRLTLFFWMPTPKSWSKKKKKAMEYTPHVSKSDLDNMEKLVGDACNEILYHDDAQIYSLTATKQYSSNPRIEITMEWD